MGGGKMQLLLKPLDRSKALKVKQNSMKNEPKICFFKSVVQKHHNFAKEPFELTFSYVKMEFDKDWELSCKVPKYAQLIQNITFKLPLPHLGTIIKDDDTFECKWKEPIGAHFIKKVEFIIGREIISSFTGEWIMIYFQLYASDEEREAFTKLNNNGVGEINVPLPFWFSKFSVQAFPIQNLLYDDVLVKITCRPLNECFVIRKKIIKSS
tara:strand:+ start:389 stop:1018 length:630 start_codon:yes stop_codon:yes gene_type:complete